LGNLVLAPSAIIAFAATALFIFALRPIALKVGLVDHPGERKSQVGKVPVIGGIAMFIGMYLVCRSDL
jgi:UDP-GlcNAc:undecaprenyl-phosphate GlcNAc-1-phosphate transferase